MKEELKREIIEEIKEELFKEKKVYIEFCREDIKLPTYANINDAGMDIRAAIDVEIKEGETKLIPTGIKLAIPEGYEIQVRPRSGISLNTPLRIANTPGTIDSNYRDEIGIIMTNTSNCNKDDKTKNSDNIYLINEKGNKNGIYKINKGDRIAQIILCKCEKITFEQVESGKIENIGLNRGGGFGHTGVN